MSAGFIDIEEVIKDFDKDVVAILVYCFKEAKYNE